MRDEGGGVRDEGGEVREGICGVLEEGWRRRRKGEG